jgi:hypothetical protein
MVERKAKIQTANLVPDHQKSGIALIYLHGNGVPHIIEKLSTKDTNLLQMSPQLEVWKKNYGLLKL